MIPRPTRGAPLKTTLPPQADQALADPTDAAQRAYVTLLFNKYRGALLRHVGKFTPSREDAADIVQDTYVRVMNRVNVSRFDAETRAYLFQTATNLARDHFRRQHFRAHAPLDDAPEDALRAPELTPEQSLAASQMNKALRAAIDAMPPQTQAVFVLARTHDRSYEQIAAELRIGRRTVERRMAEAMAVLVSRLRESL
jgi:RNA polymerase sigma factor (sigma-70 family)